MTVPSVTVQDSGLDRLPLVLGSLPPARLALIPPTGIRPDANGRVPSFDRVHRQIFSGLVSLKIKSSNAVLHDAPTLFAALVHMPRLEELALFFVAFTPYEGELPVPAFLLRRYVYSNIRPLANSPTYVFGRAKGWSLPLAVSASTLRRLHVSLCKAYELDYALSVSKLPLLERLDLRGNRLTAFPKDLGAYARLIARCPRLRHLSLHWISLPHVAHDLELLSAPCTMLRSVDLSFNPERRPPDWEVALADADAALAHVLRTSPPLRQLRLLSLILPVSHGTEEAAVNLTRAICAERQIALRLDIQHVQ